MTEKEVNGYFKELSELWREPINIILLGGAAALLMGGDRPTLDIDFQIDLSQKASFEEFSEAIATVKEKTDIDAQFSEQTERWSALSFLDIEKNVNLYRKFGSIKVFIPDPIYWSIGKISRYLTSDCQDMVQVFKNKQPNPNKLARIWRKSVLKAPRSEQLVLIKKYMIDFFKRFGKKIWNHSFQYEEIRKILEF